MFLQIIVKFMVMQSAKLVPVIRSRGRVCYDFIPFLIPTVSLEEFQGYDRSIDPIDSNERNYHVCCPKIQKRVSSALFLPDCKSVIQKELVWNIHNFHTNNIYEGNPTIIIAKIAGR